MEMRIRGQLCPVVGRVCMDMCMVDVTDLPDAAAGDVATVYDGHLLERAAALAGTIPYELMCDVNPRVPRVYLRNIGWCGAPDAGPGAERYGRVLHGWYKLRRPVGQS